MKRKLSIIVPAYNASKSIRTCINSILGQTYQNLEVIIIDDGSTDETPRIIDEYVDSDSRVIAIHQDNKGVSSARNKGLSIATGEWISFVDADDFLDGDCFSALCHQRSDLIIFPVKVFDIENHLSDFQRIKPCILVGDKLADFYAKYLSYHVFLAPWAKVYRKDVIKYIRFEETQIVGEDAIFNQLAIGSINSISILDTGSYCYYYVNSHEKYKLSVDESVEHLQRVYSAYLKHGYRCPYFVLLELSFFTYICRVDCLKNASRWFNNNCVRRMYKEACTEMGLFYKLKFSCCRIPGVFRAYHALTNKWV